MTFAILIIVFVGSGLTSEEVPPEHCETLAAQARAKSGDVTALCLGV